jgi:hypothetical protein
MDVYSTNWSESDAGNSTPSPDGFPEGMFPSGVDDSARAVMGAIKRYVDQQIPLVTGGTSTAYTLAYAVAPSQVYDGMTHLVQFNAVNGAAPTLNVNALGAKPLHKYQAGAWVAVAAGDITANIVCRVAYNAAAGAYRITSSSAPIIAQGIGANGYTMLPGPTPLLQQWGTSVVVSTGVPQTVTFPVAFSAAPYSVQVTANGNSGPLNNGSHSATSVVAASFLLTNGGANNIAFFWMAIGPA